MSRNTPSDDAKSAAVDDAAELSKSSAPSTKGRTRRKKRSTKGRRRAARDTASPKPAALKPRGGGMTAEAAAKASRVRKKPSFDESMERERQLGRVLLSAAGALVAGLALVGTGVDFGAPLVVIGMLGLVATIHFYGRLGETPPMSH